MRMNQYPESEYTEEGAKIGKISPLLELRRTIMSCLLWEDGFYENGQDIATRIKSLIGVVNPDKVAEMAVEAREKMKLRHLPLFLCACLAEHGTLKSSTVEKVIQRPDEITELLAVYSMNRTGQKKLHKLSKQLQKGIAKAFNKFDEYSLAKYNQKKEISLRDALFLSHAKPKDDEQDALWKRLIRNELKTPDTWEVELSASSDKKASWERLLKEGKLKALALLRNLRNMKDVGVDDSLIVSALSSMDVSKVLPFRFIAAAKYAPQLEPHIEKAMLKALEGVEKLSGKTALVIDTSPSMWQARISERSEMNRFEAAAALAILLRETSEDCSVYAFNQSGYIVPARRGFALRDATANTKGNYSRGGLGVELANKNGYDRIIVITDGQWHPMSGGGGIVDDRFTVCPEPKGKAYMVNVASDRNGVGYGKWTSIDGWSEAIIQYIQETEKEISQD